MARVTQGRSAGTTGGWWRDVTLVLGLLVLGAILAITSLIGDSITFDEVSHFSAGVSYLKTGDFRLTPEHPPLAEMWAALPVLLMDHRWPPPDTPGWRTGDFWAFGRTFLFGLNDGGHLVLAGRCMMVVLFLGTCLCVYAGGRMLFGPAAGLLALTLAVLSPTLLAHGRLVTTDLPLAFCFMLILLTFARLAKSLTWGTLLPAAFSVAALSVTKFSWPLIIPALVLMAAIVILRSEAMGYALLNFRPRRAGKQAETAARITRRLSRGAAIALVVAFVGAVTWLSIWTCFRWRYHSIPGNKTIVTLAAPSADETARTHNLVDWQRVLSDPTGEAAPGLTLSIVRWARGQRLLPEAYLYGLGIAARSVEGRPSYLAGEYSRTGWRSYFPIAFAIKTPVATMILLVAGLTAMVSRRMTCRRDTVLLAGLAAFTLTYGIVSVASGMNIGHRHLLPIYPAVFVFAGASAAWLKWRAGRWLIGACVAWLLLANLWIHPHYLSYFNELVGGPSRGHLYLADSNIDWGQDLKRLAKYARAHPDETIKLAYFGSADPRHYGIRCEMLPSFLAQGEPADLTAGTYVVSVTQLLGVYEPQFRDSYWTRERLDGYRRLHNTVTRVVPGSEAARRRWQRSRVVRQFEHLRRARLLSQLRHRAPDERIGYSLFVYHLTQSEVDALVNPPR